MEWLHCSSEVRYGLSGSYAVCRRLIPLVLRLTYWRVLPLYSVVCRTAVHRAVSMSVRHLQNTVQALISEHAVHSVPDYQN